ncbi:OmpA family protein [Aquicoccus sp. SU-CL01552]|uniref:OmpA family protein n=1 Tax=Aquicoccus sp. SU-CL01552 TaxID=3127656 RepID=UPI00310B50A1
MRVLFRLCAVILILPLLALAPAPQARADGPFAGGWRLDSDASELRFLSIKNGDTTEANRFTTISGLVTAQGKAQLRVLLDSVDTGIDLRNVRLRFMLFETFLHPEAVITAQLDAARLADLPTMRHKEIDLNYALSLHGMTQSGRARVAVTLLAEDRVQVASVAPIPVSATRFGMAQGIAKLEEAAEVSVVPVGVVSFSLVFEPGARAPQPAPEATGPAVTAVPASAEPGDCADRLDAASRAGGIHFAPASARLAAKSAAALDRVSEIAQGCARLRIEIAGHTDSDGAAEANLRLSRARAEAVARALATRGVDPARLHTVGHGETRPRVPNSSPANKALNRRIEFAVLQ